LAYGVHEGSDDAVGIKKPEPELISQMESKKARQR
jgi:hypothetical protein